MSRKRFILLIIYALILLGLFLLPSILHLLVDWYWFISVGYSSIFTTILFSKILLGLGIGILTFIVLYGNILLTRKLAASNLYQRTFDSFAIGICLIIAFLAGIASSGNWGTILKYFNATTFNTVDPIFARDISFYFFTLPFIEFLLSLCFLFIIISFIGSVISYALRGAISMHQFKSFAIDRRSRVHLSILIFIFFILTAVKIYFVRIPYLLYSSTGPFIGASYTDIHAVLPFLKILTVIAIIAAFLAILNIFKTNNRWIASAIILYVLVSFIGGWVYPALLQRFIVLPNELVKETPYLEHHIAATQKAFGLDKVEERDLTGETTLAVDDINNNQSTIQNIRLWDREPLLDTFGQIQEIRTYYDFVSIDNDRYTFDGDYRQVLLSPRELNSYSLPQRNFINEHLTFTHGFGLTLGPVNEVTPEGLPVLFLKDLPPVSALESLSVTRPEIYYGELSNEYVVVNTKAKEFDYPAGDENVFTNYEGRGGVKIDSLFRKALFAIKFKSLKILLSNDITTDSQIMYYRDIQSRVKRALPFLSFDSDPYLVVTNEGELKWIYDAYTTSDRYPYAYEVIDQSAYSSTNNFQPYMVKQINYIRNSVKIVIDAYDGSMAFYIANADDPLIQTYAKIFKDSFLPLDNMSEYLRAHIRYPEDLFIYQTKLYSVYHMDEVQIFYNKEDQWEIPTKAGTGRSDPMMRHMIMKLPEEEKEEFILMIPFTPRGKDNLSAWMVVRNDGEYYSQLIVYRFPKQKLVFGPTQIINRINQDTEISRQLTLWDQRGSQVIRGNLLVIPIEKSLLYVQPIYLRAEGGRIPELKRVIVAYENRIAMEETLDAALETIFSGRIITTKVSVEEAEEEVQTSTDLTKKAQDYYNSALEAQRRGDWTTYGEQINKLGEILKKLSP